MLRNKKILVMLLLVVGIIVFSKNCVKAYDVKLDSSISLPWFISFNTGTISVSSSEEGYSLYYQAVQFPEKDYAKVEEIQNSGEKTLDSLKKEIETLKNEYENLSKIYDEAYDKYKDLKKDTTADETKIDTAKKEYETAKENYQKKSSEYNAKANEYNSKVDELNEDIKKLTPSFDESKWEKTEDGKFKIDGSNFSGEKPYVIWAKLVSADGKTSYNQSIYSVSGSKKEEVDVKSIELNKTTLTMVEGSEYTLEATITPSNATNKAIKWSSDNKDVADVISGKVTAKAEGEANITASTEDGKYVATCKVTVSKNIMLINSNESTSNDNENIKVSNDNTISNNTLPRTGNKIFGISSIILVLGATGIIAYKKYKYLNFK